jgi:hypothetical protein
VVRLNFLGNVKTKNYKEHVEGLNTYQIMGCNMSLKSHFSHSHLEFFPPNMGAVSNEHGEGFHQDISTMEKRYAGKSTESMLPDYCCYLNEEISIANYKQMSYRSFKHE